MQKRIFAFVLIAAGLFFGAEQAQAEQLIGLTESKNQLVIFDSEKPGQTTVINVTGVAGTLIGIDRRPANGLLYGISNTGKIYTIDTATGAATLAASSATAPSTSASFGFDFNPASDRMRLTSNADQNLRINATTGAATTDGTLALTGDANAGANPNVVASAYINNTAGTTATTLYDLDSNLNALVTQNPPNNGTLNVVGPLGVDFTTAGFDVSGRSGVAYAVLDASGASFSSLYRINLTNGKATLVGQVGKGSGFLLNGLAASTGAPIPEPATLLLLGTGLAGVAARVRRRRKTNS